MSERFHDWKELPKDLRLGDDADGQGFWHGAAGGYGLPDGEWHIDHDDLSTNTVDIYLLPPCIIQLISDAEEWGNGRARAILLGVIGQMRDDCVEAANRTFRKHSQANSGGRTA